MKEEILRTGLVSSSCTEQNHGEMVISYLVTKFSTIFEMQSSIAMFTPPFCEPDKSSSPLCTMYMFLKIHFKISLLLVSTSTKWSLTFRFSTHITFLHLSTHLTFLDLMIVGEWPLNLYNDNLKCTRYVYQVEIALQMMNCKGRVQAYFKVVSSGGIEESYGRSLVHSEILIQSLHNMK